MFFYCFSQIWFLNLKNIFCLLKDFFFIFWHKLAFFDNYAKITGKP